MNTKKKYLQELDNQKDLYEALISRNYNKYGNPNFNSDTNSHAASNSDQNSDPTCNLPSRVFLPFIVVHTDNSTQICCEISPDRTKYFMDFTQPFSLHDDNEILKNIFSKEPTCVRSGGEDGEC
eukprot:TRINITY_DN6125_c0_g2_i9.p1 TRINITY_DN6125_c0_g2~~TRINITY_DN6125_c0_g2_i9.p1  ORF type:complete len:124 (+),score=16.91 TRINITY_DN6125_c0_g2_i9:814-1185(+)